MTASAVKWPELMFDIQECTGSGSECLDYGSISFHGVRYEEICQLAVVLTFVCIRNIRFINICITCILHQHTGLNLKIPEARETKELVRRRVRKLQHTRLYSLCFPGQQT